MVSSLRETTTTGGAGAASGRTCNAGEEMPCDPAANGRAMASI